MEKTLTGKVALIIGGSSGIGQSAALGFAKKGAKVVIASRRLIEGEASVELIRDMGGDAQFMQTDIIEESSVKTLIKQTVEHYGSLDMAFNNAGTEGPGKLLAEQSATDFDNIININLKGVYFSMKYQILQMLKQGTGGAIVNTSSIAGLVGMPAGAIYAASKHGVLGLTKSAALEYAETGIRINAVSPAAIDTPMLDRFIDDHPSFGNSEEAREKFSQRYPVKRIGKPEEVAQAAIWLCSNEASFITGESLTIDGGYTIQ